MKIMTTVLAALLLVGCDGTSNATSYPISYGNIVLHVSPYSQAKGEAFLVSGSAKGNGKALEWVDFAVRNADGYPLTPEAGITIARNEFSGSLESWDFRANGDVKVLTTADTPAGQYELVALAETADGEFGHSTTFRVR